MIKIKEFIVKHDLGYLGFLIGLISILPLFRIFGYPSINISYWAFLFGLSFILTLIQGKDFLLKLNNDLPFSYKLYKELHKLPNYKHRDCAIAHLNMLERYYHYSDFVFLTILIASFAFISRGIIEQYILTFILLGIVIFIIMVVIVKKREAFLEKLTKETLKEIDKIKGE